MASDISNDPRIAQLPAPLSGLPPSCHYIPNLLSQAEETHILSQIAATPPARWTTLSHRRLLSLPSTLTGTARDTLIAAGLPAYLSGPILPRFAELGMFKDSPHGAPNHVLINEYLPGQGIMPHEDGPAYFPCTATVSLGAAIVLDVYEKNEQGEREKKPRWRILQEPRSLLVTSGSMYTETLHGIEGATVDVGLEQAEIANWEGLGDKERYEALEGGGLDREVRVSLTYRDVIKVAKVGGAMRFLGKR
jgi:alkylated DNA repair protein alkB family protein 6